MSNLNLSQSLPASFYTKKTNEAVYESLNFEDRADFEDAKRGLVAPLGFKQLKNDEGKVVWDTEKVEFLNDTAPETVNPSLWRNSQLQAISGLFKVVDGVYQVRGLSISTTVIIEGESGIVVCDTLKSIESARAALELYYKHRPKKPVTAIIISQSHVDHFGGMEGVLEYAEHPNIPIIVPQHFTQEVISENVLLGSIMKRRSQYQFGSELSAGSRGMVCVGIGTIVTNGTTGLELPNTEIKEDIQKLTVDGLSFQFLLTPDTEAPAEMHIYIEDYKVLYASENANKTMHQIYTVRGAKTRDALKWSDALDRTIILIDDQEIEALLMAHAWPVWGKENAINHLKLQRDLYKYMHDQTVRLANHGYTMNEIAEMIILPDTLEQYWGNRGYYGTLKHNVKGIYNFYLGYYSGNPADLDPLPEIETGQKYIEYMGGVENVIKQAIQDYEKGEYRWVAQVMKHVVMIEPYNLEAKNLLADTFEQLGYQAESANWRNIYLMGAKELREGIDEKAAPYDSSKVFRNIPVDDFLKYLAVKLNGPKANGKELTIKLTVSDTGQEYTLILENSVLTYREKTDLDVDVSIITERLTFFSVIDGQSTLGQAVGEGKLKITGDQRKFTEFLSLIDSFNPLVNVVTP